MDVANQFGCMEHCFDLLLQEIKKIRVDPLPPPIIKIGKGLPELPTCVENSTEGDIVKHVGSFQEKNPRDWQIF